MILHRIYWTILLPLIIFVNNSYCQDIIILKTGEEILSKVEKVGSSEIDYKKYENLTGPVYTKRLDEIFMIKYENGSKDVFNKIQESNPTISKTPQIDKVEKQDNFDFIVGINVGVGFLTGNDIENVYGNGETHFRIITGPKIRKASILAFYEKTTSNGHPLDENGNQYEELTSKMNLNIVGVQASFGNVFYFGPRLASVTIKESFVFESTEAHGESSGVLIGLNLGLATKRKFQFFGEIYLDYLSFNENEIDEGAIAKNDASFVRGSINAGIRLRL